MGIVQNKILFKIKNLIQIILNIVRIMISLNKLFKIILLICQIGAIIIGLL